MKRIRLLFSILLALAVAPSMASDDPLPESLAQWYKPQSERQVWLHTMFSLRREMQAVEEYVDAGEYELATKWANKLSEHYLSIGKMVPEWREDLDLEALEMLAQGLSNKNPSIIAGATRDLGRNCGSCHKLYRAVAAARFRAPDFKPVKVADGQGGERDYPKTMESLSTTLNRIAIAGADERWSHAGEHLDQLGKELQHLEGSCEACHQDSAPAERIFGEPVQREIDALAQAIQDQNSKTFGRQLGGVAVQVCARCHGVHRTLYDLTEKLPR